jgi:hypothetical protein
MKLAIMQPYFLPYIGYFQLMAAVDEFVVYDNIKYTKKGWINRNRLLQNGKDVMFSLPLRQGSDSSDIVERELASSFDDQKLLHQFQGAYASAPYFSETIPLLERVVRCKERNLFRYLHNSIAEVCNDLGLSTRLRVSSDIPIDHGLRSQEKVIAICRALGATTYINAVGGLGLYDRPSFEAAGVELQFLQARPFEYPQFGAPFVPWLSIVDVLMFNPRNVVRERIASGFELI